MLFEVLVLQWFCWILMQSFALDGEWMPRTFNQLVRYVNKSLLCFVLYSSGWVELALLLVPKFSSFQAG